MRSRILGWTNDATFVILCSLRLAVVLLGWWSLIGHGRHGLRHAANRGFGCWSKVCSFAPKSFWSRVAGLSERGKGVPMRSNLSRLFVTTCSLGALVASVGCTSTPPDLGEVGTQVQGEGFPPPGILGCTSNMACTMASMISGEAHIAVINASGEVYAWGMDYSGQIGVGTAGRQSCYHQDYGTGTNCRPSPSKVTLPDVATAITAAVTNTAAIVGSEGQIYVWGGLGASVTNTGTTDRTVPARLLASSAAGDYFKGAEAIASSHGLLFALKKHPINPTVNFAQVWTWTTGYPTRVPVGNSPDDCGDEIGRAHV